MQANLPLSDFSSPQWLNLPILLLFQSEKFVSLPVFLLESFAVHEPVNVGFPDQQVAPPSFGRKMYGVRPL